MAKTTQNTNEETIKFRIIEVKEITTKEGKKFKAYKTVGKGGRKLDVRFVQGCSNLPTEPCTIIVKKCNANVDKTRLYPILWVKDIEEIEANERKNNLDEFFGDENESAQEI